MERCYKLLEEIESWEGACVDCLTEGDSSSKRKRILWDHRARICIDKIQSQLAERCLNLIDSNAIQTEFCSTSASGDMWTSFYDQMRDIQSYYKKFGGALSRVADLQVSADSSANTAQVIEDLPNLGSVFTRSEEMRGKVLDLTEPYRCFLNWNSFKRTREREHRQNCLARLKKIKFDRELKKRKADHEAESALSLDDITIDENHPDVRKRLVFVEADYAKFVKQYVGGLDAVPRHCKYRDNDFMNYGNCLSAYLESFHRRCNPLAAVEQWLIEMRGQFEQLWEKKLLKNWFPNTYQLNEYYCPYTDRLFGSEQAATGHKNSKKYKAIELSKADSTFLTDMQTKSIEHDKELAFVEYKITRLLDALSGLLDATLQNLRKKQSRTIQEINDAYRELNHDDGEEYVPDQSSSDGSDAFDMNTSRIKNPLNLPVGWDGKPIPYWLYRLHGLSHSYTCEICGNQKYWGKKVFENHFREWRHAFGMRCLKIPNTVHFKEITKIEDALNLYERLRTDNEGRAFLPDQEVEVEDQQGNVMTPQTFDDLRKQGLL